ncbi:MAG: hypothetical protein ABSC91_07595 [Candidatus Bathyarchaeia archaeon]|jgi:hypothetical protein
MFDRREEIQKWFYEIVEKFRQKGAVSPDKALTAEELSLPPRFDVAMKRRLGRLNIFVEVNGKYYLSEERLKQREEMHSAVGTGCAPRKNVQVENNSDDYGRSFPGFLSCKFPRSEFGVKSCIAPLHSCLASHIGNADLLYV